MRIPPPAEDEAPALRLLPVLHLLIADDMPVNRELAQAFLSIAGHHVVCAEDGAAAVELAATGAFDVVLMDIRMPGIDGLEATRRIRALPGEAGLVPIIGQTAQASADEIQLCRAAGMDGHIAKPYGADELCRAVQAGFDARPAPQLPFAPAAPLIGAGLCIVDEIVAGQLRAFIPPTALAAHLRIIAERAEAVLEQLSGTDAPNGEAIAELVHTLGGSAGMCGFLRLATVGRLFEHAARAGSAAPSPLSEALRAAIHATRPVIAARIVQLTAA